MSMIGRFAAAMAQMLGLSANPPRPHSARAALTQGEDLEAFWRAQRPPPPQSTTEWFQDDIAAAIHSADAGDVQMASRLCKSLRRDGVCGGVLSTRTGGLTRLPRRFRGHPDAVEALSRQDGQSSWDAMFPSKEVQHFLGDMILLNVAVGEMLPVAGSPDPEFVRLDPEFLRYRWSEDRWYYLTVGGLIPITPGDGRWVLYAPGQQPWAHGMWSALARSYIAKEHAFSYRENYSGKLAHPARVAISPNGASDAQDVSWFQKVAAWGMNTVFGLKPGYDVKLLESNGRGFDVFQQTIETSDKEFMIALAGQIVTITGGVGFANADVFRAIRADLIQDDGDTLAGVLNRQALGPWVRRRWGAAASVAMSWDTKPPSDLKADADAIISAAKAITDANAALETYGVRVNAKEIATRYGVPILDIEPAAKAEPTVTPAVPEPSPDPSGTDDQIDNPLLPSLETAA